MSASEAQAQNKLFVANVTKWVERSRGDVDVVLRSVLMQLAGGIGLRTPVDTGRLNANWQFGTSEIPTGVTDDTSKTPLAQRLAGEIKNARAGTIHYIVNNLPYAPVIEYGLYGKIKHATGPRGPRAKSVAPRENRVVEQEKKAAARTSGGFSIKAPAGMVRVTVVEYKDYLDRAVQQVKGGA